MNATDLCANASVRLHSYLEQRLTFAPFSVYLERLLIPIWICVGVPGGLCSLLVWSSRRMRSSSSMYLCALAILDCVFLLLVQVVWHLHNAYGKPLLRSPVMCHVFPVFSYTLQYLSPLLTLGFTVERYISICHPFKRERLCTVKRALVVITALSLACLSCGLVQLKFYNVLEGECQEDERIFDPASFEANFYKAWSTSSEVFFFIAVPVLILVFNILVLAQARRSSAKQLGGQSQKGKSTAATVTLLTVSFYQIAAVLPVSIMQFAGLVYAQFNLEAAVCGLTDEQAAAVPRVQEYFAYITVRYVTATLAVSHYAMKFFIYLLTGSMFVRQFATMLGSRLPCLRHLAAQPEMQLPVRRTAEQRRRMRAAAGAEDTAMILTDSAVSPDASPTA